MDKTCSICNKLKPIIDFYKNNKSKDGHDSRCKKCKIAKNHIWYLSYISKPHNREKQIIRGREKRWKRKLKVIEEYGGKCVCCGETEVKFLSIDHINGGGSEERKNGLHGRNGSEFYIWLIKNNYPKDNYQILCFNCNCAKGFYGKCPHNK